MFAWKGDDTNLAILGGVIIAAAAIANLYIMGRITGISGMSFVVVRMKINEGFYWKYSFLTGMMLTGFALYLSEGKYIKIGKYYYQIFDATSKATKGVSPIEWVVAGLLVGLGTRLAKGCTSGHAICGIPCLSARSAVSVMIFLVSGMLVSTVRNSMGQLRLGGSFKMPDTYYEIFQGASMFFAAAMFGLWIFIAGRVFTKGGGNDRFDPIISFVIGGVYGLGLVLSGLVRRSKVLGFLTLDKNWDPAVMYVLATAIIINTAAFQLILRRTHRPLLVGGYNIPINTNNIDWQLLVGSVLFGVGWGILGLCPGPGLINLFVVDQASIFIIFFVIGQMLSYFFIEGRINHPVYQPIE